MSRIIYGLYEQIINGIINDNLNKVDQELVIKDTQPLDSAESSKILADYLARILREIFNYIDEGDTIVAIYAHPAKKVKRVFSYPSVVIG